VDNDWSGGRLSKEGRLSSSRHHESEVWQGLYRLEEEVVWTLRGATGRYGGATGGKRGPLRVITVMCLLMIHRV
jgi:hypothetical protein